MEARFKEPLIVTCANGRQLAMLNTAGPFLIKCLFEFNEKGEMVAIVVDGKYLLRIDMDGVFLERFP